MSDERAKSLWARTYQVGLVVRDVELAARFYERIGIGPFTDGPSAVATERRIYGKLEPDAVVKGLITKIGSFELELLQPVSGASIQAEFLRTHGEGVLHLCAYTDDLDRDIATMSDLGFPVISSANLSDGGKFAYFDTRATGGVILELFQPGSDWA